MAKWILLSLLVVAPWSRTTAQSYSNYSNLFNNVLNGYNPNIIPLDDHTQTMNVTVYGYLYSLIDVDVVLGKVTIVLALIAEWEDSQIHWTPSDYGNLSSISIPRTKVWSPDFVLGTPVDFSTIGDSWMPVELHCNGLASLNLADAVNSACQFNMKFWPFDKQVCDVGFVVYGYTMSQLRLQLFPTKALYLLSDNIEWDISNAFWYILEDRGVSEVMLRIELERKSSIFVILIIFPLYGIASLTPFVFLLPSDSGERIGFSTTILLSLTVFMDVISDYIPNASTPLPLLVIVVTMGVSMSLTCTLVAVLSLYFYHKDEGIPVGGFFVMFVKLFNVKFRKHKVETKRNTDEENDTYSHTMHDKTTLQMSIKDITYTPEETYETRTTSGDVKITTSGDLNISWKDVSYTIDKVCFTGGALFHGLIMICFTCYMALGLNSN